MWAFLWIRMESRELHLGFRAAALAMFRKKYPCLLQLNIPMAPNVFCKMTLNNGGVWIINVHQYKSNIVILNLFRLSFEALEYISVGGWMKKAISLFFGQCWLWQGPALAAFLASDDSDSLLLLPIYEGILRASGERLAADNLHFFIWINTFGNLDKCILQFYQIHFAIWTNIFWNLSILRASGERLAADILQHKIRQIWKFCVWTGGQSVHHFINKIMAVFWKIILVFPLHFSLLKRYTHACKLAYPNVLLIMGGWMWIVKCVGLFVKNALSTTGKTGLQAGCLHVKSIFTGRQYLYAYM